MPTQSVTSAHKPQITISSSPREASAGLAASIAEAIRDRASQGKTYTLGLATGSTPIPLYQELIRLHREAGLSFRNVYSFNLDEYYGMSPSHSKSYHHFMRNALFDEIDIPTEQWHIPNGETPRNEIGRHCQAYEEAIENAGGIDLQILGIGRTGHIGFNEPPSQADSATRLIILDPLTKKDAAPTFGGVEHVPNEAITLGVSNILKARQIALMAWGEGKSEILARTFNMLPTPNLPATFLLKHPNFSVYLDRAAAQKLPPNLTCQPL